MYFHTHHYVLNGESSIVILEEIILCINDSQYFWYRGNRLSWSIHNMNIHITPVEHEYMSIRLTSTFHVEFQTTYYVGATHSSFYLFIYLILAIFPDFLYQTD